MANKAGLGRSGRGLQHYVCTGPLAVSELSCPDAAAQSARTGQGFVPVHRYGRGAAGRKGRLILRRPLAAVSKDGATGPPLLILRDGAPLAGGAPAPQDQDE